MSENPNYPYIPEFTRHGMAPVDMLDELVVANGARVVVVMRDSSSVDLLPDYLDVKIMDQGKYPYSWTYSTASALLMTQYLDRQFGTSGPRVTDEPLPPTPKPPVAENSETPEQKRQRYRSLAKQRKRRAAIDVQVVAVGLLMAIGVVLVSLLAVH